MSPVELLEKLAALVAPPRKNLIRYHCVLAPNAHLRKAVVARVERPTKPPRRQAGSRRLLWAEALRVRLVLSGAAAARGGVRLTCGFGALRGHSG